MKKLTVLLVTICFMLVAASCSKGETSTSSTPDTSIEESLASGEASANHAQAPTADEFKNEFIDPVIKVHLGEMGYDLKIKEATVEVFKFISKNIIFKCNYDEITKHLDQAISTLSSDDLDTFRSNIDIISDLMEGLKLGNEETIRSFDDIEAKETVEEYLSDPANYESWMAIQTVLSEVLHTTDQM